ncbi:plasmid stabilization protein [Salinimicrobium sp. CDJ15-81-2]|nr:plasmid stabilization protein [Salinimicrobium nanhaiense]
MIISYNRKFKKDLEKLKEKNIKAALKSVIQELKEKQSLSDIKGVKKISGHPTAYRIRIGNYRLGLYHNNGTLSLQRFVKRNDIYKVFP